MKASILFFSSALISAVLVSCSPGYQEENGEWVWVSYDEAAGRRITKIDSVDSHSFEVLANEKYGKDRTHVFYKTELIRGADPNTFKIMTENGYAMDRHNVFLRSEKVVFADPGTFETLEFPYSRDANRVFCGTLPLDVNKNEVKDFRVTNEDELMSGMTSNALLSYFIRSNPDYNWLDTVGVNGVIVAEYATGETSTRKFKGFREVK